MNKKLLISIAIIGCFIGALFVGVWVLRNPSSVEIVPVPDLTQNSDTYTSDTYTHDYAQITNPDGSSSIGQLFFRAPDGTRYLVPDSVSAQIDGPSRTRITNNYEQSGANINAGKLPLNPKNPDELIIPVNSAGCVLGNDSSCVNTFYAYNLKTQQIRTLYTSPVIEGKIEFMIIAVEDSRLILVMHQIGTDSICPNEWLRAPSEYVYLDAGAVQNGFQPYVVSAQKIADAQREYDACVNELSRQ